MQVLVPADSAILELPRERTSPLNGNHVEIVKYSSIEDNNYSRVAGNIARLVAEINANRKSDSGHP